MDWTPSTSPGAVQHFLKRKLSQSVGELPPCSLLPMISGTAAFASALAASTFAQLRLLGVSTGSAPPIPTLLGLGSVGAASVLSQWAAVGTYDALRRGRGLGSDSRTERRWLGSSVAKNYGQLGCNAHTLRVCALGLVAFKFLGGRFWSVSPSSYTHLGSFARASLPATMKYGTAKERAAIEKIGKTFGCHTCGSRMIFSRLPGSGVVKFHADHMPPKAVAEQMNHRWYRRMMGRTVRQRFYPQCVDCSNSQGGILASASNEMRRQMSSRRSMGTGLAKTDLKAAGGGRAAHFHGLRPRLHHVAGGVVAAVTVWDADEADILNGNLKRFESLQGVLIDIWMDVCCFVRDSWSI